MSALDALVVTLFNEKLDDITMINALRLTMKKPLLEKGGRGGGAVGERLLLDRTIAQYIKKQAEENKNAK